MPTSDRSDPIARFRELFERAHREVAGNAEAVTLATADERGRASARTVLLKGVDERGFVFFTNFASRKARELDANRWASLCFFWTELAVQVRVEGPVRRVPAEESDAYFATRPRPSQVAAWASRQSEPLGSRRELEERFEELERRFGEGPVPRPDFWGGYRIAPERIEFWTSREHRLHDRELYTRDGDAWRVTLLQP